MKFESFQFSVEDLKAEPEKFVNILNTAFDRLFQILGGDAIVDKTPEDPVSFRVRRPDLATGYQIQLDNQPRLVLLGQLTKESDGAYSPVTGIGSVGWTWQNGVLSIWEITGMDAGSFYNVVLEVRYA